VIKRMMVMLLLTGLVLGGVYAFQVFKTKLIGKVLADYAAAPKTVSDITVGYQDWQTKLAAVGTVQAAQSVDIASQVGGIVDEVDFDSGQQVAANARLVQLRLNDGPARLKQLQAAAAIAGLTYARDRLQFSEKAVSQAVLDNDAATLKSAQAQVEAQQAVLAEYTISAPFAGRLGIRQVNVGQYLNPGTAIVTLQALDTLYVDFLVPQQDLATIAVGQPVSVTADAFPGKVFTGAISAIDAKVDVGTRNVVIRARLGNAPANLLPGMFVAISVSQGSPQKLLTVPQTAIAFNAYGDTVFIVKQQGEDADGKPKLVADQNFVTVGAVRGDQVSVLKGLTAGDVVVTSGQNKLSNNTAIVINNAVQPDDSANPPDDLVQ
jgi:membrane fusion protein (multidrug efflux system)